MSNDTLEIGRAHFAIIIKIHYELSFKYIDLFSK